MSSEAIMDSLHGSPMYQQSMDKKKAEFKPSPGKNKNPPKKEGFLFSFVKPFPEASTVPLPPDPEDYAVTSEKMFEKKPNCEQKDLEKEFFIEDDKVRQGEGTDPPHPSSVVSLCAPK